MSSMNRFWNTQNRFQYPEKYKRVLCVCSAGLLRSPTTAVILAGEPYNFNTRAAGIDEDHALVPVDDVLISWADEIVCMTKQHHADLVGKFHQETPGKRIYVLDIPDNFGYRNPKLVELIKERYAEVSGWGKEPCGEIVPEKVEGANTTQE